MLRFCAFWGNTYGFKISKILTFTLKIRQQIIYYLIVAYIVVWQSYFAHSCCQIHFTLFCRKFALGLIHAPILGKLFFG